MKFLAAAAVAVLATTAEAIVAFTNSAFDVEAGKPFTLTWSGATGPVTITLRNGPTRDLQVVTTIDSDDTGTSFTWTPPATLPSDTYTFVIQDSIDQNYSKQFTFQGAANPSTTASGTTTASPSTSSEPSSSTASSSTEENSTTASPSSSATTSASETPSASPTESEEPTSVPSNTNDGQRYKSPLALVLVTVAALLYFN